MCWGGGRSPSIQEGETPGLGNGTMWPYGMCRADVLTRVSLLSLCHRTRVVSALFPGGFIQNTTDPLFLPLFFGQEAIRCC